MLERVAELRAEAEKAIEGAADSAALEELRVRYLGRKAELTGILRGIGELPAEQRGEVGKAANEAQRELEELIGARRAALEAAELEDRFAAEPVDVTLPGSPARPVGHLHLLT